MAQLRLDEKKIKVAFGKEDFLFDNDFDAEMALMYVSVKAQ